MIVLRDKLCKKIKKFKDYKLIIINKKYKWEFKIFKIIVKIYILNKKIIKLNYFINTIIINKD